MKSTLAKRKNVLSRLFLALSALCAPGAAFAQSPPGALPVVPSVDLQRYMGRWYEIARLPAWFERSCASDATARYTLQSDGTIRVVNECRRADGSRKVAQGIARKASSHGPNSKLKVRFFWPFSGDYWILDLDPQYGWVLVGEPSRKYLWILARKPKLDSTVYARLVDRARSEGFDTASLIVTRQTP